MIMRQVRTGTVDGLEFDLDTMTLGAGVVHGAKVVEVAPGGAGHVGPRPETNDGCGAR